MGPKKFHFFCPNLHLEHLWTEVHRETFTEFVKILAEKWH